MVMTNEVKDIGDEDSRFVGKPSASVFGDDRDVILSIFIPCNATPELTLGVSNRNDKRIILDAHVADIRMDNRNILCAFVLKGGYFI